MPGHSPKQDIILIEQKVTQRTEECRVQICGQAQSEKCMHRKSFSGLKVNLRLSRMWYRYKSETSRSLENDNEISR
jgi:hypothetical protein